jgi:hypothetical protein
MMADSEWHARYVDPVAEGRASARPRRSTATPQPLGELTLRLRPGDRAQLH